MCGLCVVFRGKNSELAYEDYINGKRNLWMYRRIINDKAFSVYI